MQKTLTITTALLISSLFAFGQNFEKQFKNASSKKDAAEQVKVLQAWEKASPKDSELFIGYFNYYVQKSRNEVISLDKTKKTGESLMVSDTGTGRPVAYLNASTNYKADVLQKAFEYINQGIALHPNRLDMRFGRIYMLGETKNYQEFTRRIIETIEYGHQMGNAWLWKDGKPVDSPKQFLLGSLQDYITTIYNTEDDNLLPLMRQISETVIRYYPEHVESLSNIALTYLITGDFAKALPFLLKAEQIAPKDVIVLNNIAEAYKRQKDTANAKAYYEKVIKYGNKEEVLDAKKKLKSLL